MRHVKLPELNKNCVVEQQKILVFDEKCKYDVFLAQIFCPKMGIGIEYSTGIIEWFDNKLPMRDPHQLDDKEYLAMAEILEVQRKAEHLFGMDWYDPTCDASENWTQNMGQYYLITY
jgi:hypothetical protein